MSVLLLIGAFPFVLLAVVILVGALDRGIPKRRLGAKPPRDRVAMPRPRSGSGRQFERATRSGRRSPL